uniref:Uncharacterized protein n=1 Tax=Arundo donax TaxID=35708 RepID=A0A0A9AJ65_ARUDO
MMMQHGLLYLPTLQNSISSFAAVVYLQIMEIEFQILYLSSPSRPVESSVVHSCNLEGSLSYVDITIAYNFTS